MFLWVFEEFAGELTHDPPFVPDASERSPFYIQSSFPVHLSFLPVTVVALPSGKGAGTVTMALPSPEGAFVHATVCCLAK